MPQPRTGETASERTARIERETTATELAIKTAIAEERVRAKLEQHDEDIRELRTSQAETIAALRTLGTQMTRVETQIGEQIAAAKAVAQNTVSNRTFILGVLAVIAAFAGAIIQNGHI